MPLALEAMRRDPVVGARALEALFEMQGRGKTPPERETYTYPQLASMGFGGRSPIVQTLPKLAPWAIRRFSDIPPSRRALNAITNPILDMPFTLGVRRPLGSEAHDIQPPPTDDQKQRIERGTAMFLRPNNSEDGREFLEKIIEDLLCMGAGPFEAEENTSDDRPLFLWPVDVQSVRLNANWQPGSSTYRFSQGRGYLFGSVGTTDEVKLSDDQLCYPKLNARSSTPFGLGYLEVAFETVNSFMGAFDFATRRASNSTPLFGLFLGENMTIDQVRQWQHYWENEIEGYGKTPIIGGGRQPSVFSMAGSGDDALYLAWQEWLVRIIAMAFGLSPMQLGLERDVNRSTATTQSANDWTTVAPVANLLRDAFTHWILWKRLGWVDLEFQWQVKTSDELRQAEILATQYECNGITVDEIRKVYERPPLPDGLGDMTKTAYETAVKMAAMSVQPANDAPAEESKPPQVSAASFITPFDEEVDDLSPQEAAFLRALMREKRRERIGLRAVAG